jgi:hypothetical protein
MNKWMIFCALLCLGGCASPHCDTSISDNESSHDNPCRAEHLLYQNDMLQAKLMISAGGSDNIELAKALFERAASHDQSGEAEFYQAVLVIRASGDNSEAIDLLEHAAKQGHPLAIALLAQQLASSDAKKAEQYRADYADLDVAKSGYPSFEQALNVANGLIAPVL